MNSPEGSAASHVERFLEPLIAACERKPLMVGVCGAQGSGKTTVSRKLSQAWLACGVSSATLSLDDLYLSRIERMELSQRVHPLLRTRGVPGTHDVALGLDVFAKLRAGEPTLLPRFDKALDDRSPAHVWTPIDGLLDVLLFEGWCVGAGPQPDDNLVPPVNSLEAEEDADGRWRRYVNAALGGAYQTLFGELDVLIFLAAPSFDVVRRWRREQEVELRARSLQRGAQGVMDDSELERFVQHFERLTRFMLEELPMRADLVLQLAEDRSVVRATTRRADK